MSAFIDHLHFIHLSHNNISLEKNKSGASMNLFGNSSLRYETETVNIQNDCNN